MSNDEAPSEPTTVIRGVAYRTWQHRDPLNAEGPVSWVEYEPFEPWTVALGFIDRDGALELAEVHITPTRDDPGDRSSNPNLRHREPGTWRRDAQLVPVGGLKAEFLREFVKVSDPGRAALQNVPTPSSYLGRAGFVAADRVATEVIPRTQRSPNVLAFVATKYEEAREQGMAASTFIAAELNQRGVRCAPSSVANLVHAARGAGFLPTTERGRGGGKATAHAHKLLERMPL